MIAKYFIELIIFLVGQFLTLISSFIPDNSYISVLTTAINSLFGVTTQVANFAYFLFGDLFYRCHYFP